MSGLDWCILLGYALFVLTIGWFVSRGQSTAHGHLRAGRNLPAWAVVFSVLAAEISAATYIGVPEAAFKGNWNYMQFAIGALLGKWVLATYFVKLYWRLNLATVYGFLGQRIGPATQKASAWAFLAGRLIATGVRLFIAALAFSVVTGLSLEWAVVAMAAISTVYTALGGLKAVVWTDVAQGSIFFLGATTAVAVGLWKLGEPIGDVVSAALAAGKLQFITFEPGEGLSWFTSLRPLPVAVLGGFFLALASHGTDQETVQHMLNTRSERSSGLTVFVSGFATFPIVAMFLAVGTVLWAYHRKFPPTDYGIGTPDEVRRIFPNFIMFVLPSGIRGLVFAGLFAAAIGSLGATINSVAAAWTHDIRPHRGEPSLFRVKASICVFGGLLAAIALFFAWFARDTKSDLVQIALQSMTILYGGILGTFLVALWMQRRGSDRSVPLGMLVGVVSGALLCFHKQIFGLKDEVLVWPFYLPISAGLTMLVSCLGRRALVAVR